MKKLLRQHKSRNWLPKLPWRSCCPPNWTRRPCRMRPPSLHPLRTSGSSPRAPVRCGCPATGEPGERQNAPPEPYRSAGSCGSDRQFPPPRWPPARQRRRRIRIEANRAPETARGRSTRSPLRRPTNPASADAPEAQARSWDAARQAPAGAPAAVLGPANCLSWIAC